MSKATRNNGSSETKPRQCPICSGYLRKIEEVEQILSGREAVVAALQTQLKKCENNYKNLFSSYEQLRFEHSSAVQDNYSLKEINSKLEAITISEKKLTNDYSETDPRSRSLKESSKFSSTSPPLLQRVNSIEKLVKTQNEILRQLLEKLIKELKCNKDDKNISIQDLAVDSFRQIESGDHLDTHPQIQKLQLEIEKLRSLLEEQERENERLRKILEDKRIKLTKCTTASTTIDSSVHTDLDYQESADMTDPSKLTQMQQEMAEKEKYFEQCSCQLVDQLQDMHDNNQILSDTLAVITAENKNNLDLITKLKEELNRVNQECEEKTNTMRARINQLENDLDDSKVAEEKLRESVHLSENEANELQGKLKYVIEENCKMKDCKCDAEKEFRMKLLDAEVENDDLRKELTEKTLELTEFEEENRYFCQRMEVLTNFNNELTHRVRDLEFELLEKSKEVEQSDMATQVSLTGLHQLEVKVSQLNEEKHCLNEKCRLNQIEMEDNMFQLDCLRNSVKLQLDEYDKMMAENEELRQEIDRLKRESKKEVDRLQGEVVHSQNQVEMLLQEHDEKTAQFECVAKELDTIRRSVTEDNEKFVCQIKEIEEEKEELMKTVKEHERCKECNCEQGRAEIDRLKADLIKKQCIILELEKSVDNFNETMKNFDKTAEELADENAALKAQREDQDRAMKALQEIMCEKMKEIEQMQEPLKLSQKECEMCSKNNKLLEAENEHMKTEYQMVLNRNKKVELENLTLQSEIETFKADHGKLARTFVDNCQLQTDIENLKENQTRRESTVSAKLVNLQKAYDELKKLFDQRNIENEKLNDELRKCSKSLGETKKFCKCAEEENEKLKKQITRMSAEMENLKTESDKLRKDCVKKCVEVEFLKESVDDKSKEKRVCQEDCKDLKQTNIKREKELSELKDKVVELRKSEEQKSQELKKVKKQFDSCSKQCQITREEYNNLRKEYKEIKTMMSEQIKKYKMDTDGMSASKSCQVVKDMQQLVMQKEHDMTVLQQNLKEASYEIIELKDYIHKLICDNNVLKSGINNLIGNLERKIKGPSFGSLPSNSAEAIAGEILHSLSNIESIIVNKSSDVCPKGCRENNCNCMSEITSQYKELRQDCRVDKVKDRTGQSTGPYLSKSMSEPIKPDSETNTDSSSTCLDHKSVQLMKGAIQDLKTSIDCTMKEKCCDCEEYASRK